MSQAHSWTPDLFSYLDYREYLRDYYNAAKENTSYMSFRYLSKRAGFKSPNYVKLVMDGERNLSAQGASKVASAIGLKAESRRFFLDLVRFNQSEAPEERNKAFERLSASQSFRDIRRLEQEVFEFLSHWYYPAIREMVARSDFREDHAWIGAQLLPQIKPDKVKDAIELMLSIGLLVRDDAGALERAEPNLTTGHVVQKLAASNYHRQMIKLAGESIERVHWEKRFMSTTTMCISREQYEDIKSRIFEFREQVIGAASEPSDADRVYQFSLQFFPLNQVE